jgi:hypothetical protein
MYYCAKCGQTVWSNGHVCQYVITYTYPVTITPAIQPLNKSPDELIEAINLLIESVNKLTKVL